MLDSKVRFVGTSLGTLAVTLGVIVPQSPRYDFIIFGFGIIVACSFTPKAR